MKKLLLQNSYSILFAIFTVLNWSLLQVFYKGIFVSDLACMIWIAIHAFAYWGLVRPEEKKLREMLDKREEE